jgi:quercetin dioxygenase-like cupin family protein
MPAPVKSADVPECKVVRTGGEGAMVVRRGYGNEFTLMYATRAPGYHTTPHAHEAEQINYLLEGEIWIFVEDRRVFGA